MKKLFILLISIVFIYLITIAAYFCGITELVSAASPSIIIVDLPSSYSSGSKIYPNSSQSSSSSIAISKNSSANSELELHDSNNSTVNEFGSVDESSIKGVCNIHELKYSDAEFRSIYRFNTYSSCKTKTNDLIYIEDDLIHAECEQGEPLFSIDPAKSQILGGFYKEEVEWGKNRSIGSHAEYAFIKCGKSIYSLFFFRPNKTISNKANEIRFKKNYDKKPLNVLLLVIDSVSRFTTYKYLPKLTKYLNDQKSSSDPNSFFSLYEFTKFGVPETNTVPNMAQILYGKSIETIETSIKVAVPDKTKDSPEHIAYQKVHSIWNYYKSQGFITLFYKDTIFDYISQFIGRRVTSDHSFLNYWRSAWPVYGFHDVSNRQRCMGNQNSHNLSFGYVYDYFEKYENNNKFAYLHLDAAHENSGNIQTVDQDGKDFFIALTQMFKRKNENFVIYFMSDHGFKFDKLKYDVRGFIEGSSPFGYLFVSKEVEEKLKAREFLRYNSEMLIGRFDTNLMLKYLAHYPYDMPNKEYFEKIKEGYGVKSAVNIFNEKISPYRTCDQIGVPKYRCICSWFEPINFNDDFQSKILSKTVDFLDRYFKDQMKKIECEEILGLEIIDGEVFNIHDASKGKVTLFSLDLKMNNSTFVGVEFYYCVKNKKKKNICIKTLNKLPFTDLNVQNENGLAQITSIVVNEPCNQDSCLCKWLNKR